jgi:hypothetical protein
MIASSGLCRLSDAQAPQVVLLRDRTPEFRPFYKVGLV